MKIKKIVLFVITATFLTSCGSPSPKDVTTQLIESLSKGDCEKAQSLTVDDAFFIVQMIIDGGCMKDEITLKTVLCEESENTASCTCIGDKNGQSIDYTYNLKKTEDGWKVSSWPLDF